MKMIEKIWSGKGVEYARTDAFGNVIGTGTYNFDDEIDEDGSGPVDEYDENEIVHERSATPEGFDSVEDYGDAVGAEPGDMQESLDG